MDTEFSYVILNLKRVLFLSLLLVISFTLNVPRRFFNSFYYKDETHSAEKELPIEKILVGFRVVLHACVQLVTD